MRFLKLTKYIININNISYIEKEKNKFNIVLNRAPFIDGFLMFGSGAIGSESKTFEVHHSRENNDYEIVKQWIEKYE